MAGQTRCTAAEKNFRANRVAQMIARGASRSDIVQYAAQEWGLSKRQADTYIKFARDTLMEDWNIDRHAYLATLLAQLNIVHKKSIEQGCLNVTLGAINTAAKLVQLLD